MPPQYNTTYGSVPRNESGYMMFKTLRRVSPERSLSFWFRRMWVVALRARLVKCNKGASNTAQHKSDKVMDGCERGFEQLQ